MATHEVSTADSRKLRTWSYIVEITKCARWVITVAAFLGALVVLLRMEYRPEVSYWNLLDRAWFWSRRNLQLSPVIVIAIIGLFIFSHRWWVALRALATKAARGQDLASIESPLSGTDSSDSKPTWLERNSRVLVTWIPRIFTYVSLLLLAWAAYMVVTAPAPGSAGSIVLPWWTSHWYDSMFLFTTMFVLTVARFMEVLCMYVLYEKKLASRSLVHKSHRSLVNGFVRFGLFSIRYAYFSNPKIAKEMDGLELELRAAKFHHGGWNGEEANNAVENLKDVRFSNIYTAMFHGLGTSLTVALGLPSLTLALVFCIMPIFHTELSGIHLWAFMIYVLWFCSWFYWIVLEPLLCWLLRTFVLTMPARDYASLVADALDSSQLMVFINFKVHRLCYQYQGILEVQARSTMLHAKDSEDCFQCLRSDENGQRKAPDEDATKALHLRFIGMRDSIAKHYFPKRSTTSGTDYSVVLDRFLQDMTLLEELKTQEREKESARIEILIKLYADRHGIRYEEVCENIFQFSPQLFRAWSIKYRQNSLAIIELLRSVQPIRPGGPYLDRVLYDRMRRMCCQNERFMDRVGRIMRRQVQSMALRTLHNDVIELASTRSSSDAVKVYIRSLAEIGRQWSKELNDNGRNIRFAQRCSFVFFKSRAHVGMSVHDSMCRILGILPGSRATGVTVPPALEVKGLQEALSTEVFMDWVLHPDKVPTSPSGASMTLDEYCTLLANAFAHLHPAALSLLDTMRAQVIDKVKTKVFTDRATEIANAQHIVVLTFGFSKMVRDVVRNVFAEQLSLDRYAALKAKTTFVVLDLKGRTQESIRLKYMMAERKLDSSSHVQDLLVADIDFVLDLITKDTLVFVLMGADTFQTDTQRLLRTSHGKRTLWSLYRSVAAKHGLHLEQGARMDGDTTPALTAFQQQFQVVVLAESYKRVDALLPLTTEDKRASRSSKKALFLNDHYHSADIYEKSMLPFTILSDDLEPPQGPTPSNTPPEE